MEEFLALCGYIGVSENSECRHAPPNLALGGNSRLHYRQQGPVIVLGPGEHGADMRKEIAKKKNYRQEQDAARDKLGTAIAH